MAIRSVSRVIEGVATLEGGGFLVNTDHFPPARCPILIHSFCSTEMGPTDVRPGEAKVYRITPHRGFETVTIFYPAASVTKIHRNMRGSWARAMFNG